MSDLTVLEHPETASLALSPLRRQILGLLDEPASATDLASRLGLTRQKLNYHLSLLARHRLVEVVETRQRRGFEERVYQRSGRLVLAPDLVQPFGDPDPSAEAVVAAASDAIRAVGRLSARTTPHPTATLTTDITFAGPGDVRAFLEEVGRLAARFDSSEGVTMRMTLLGHVHEEPDHE